MGGLKGFWGFETCWPVGPPRKLNYYSSASLVVDVLLRGVPRATLGDEEGSNCISQGRRLRGSRNRWPRDLQLCQDCVVLFLLHLVWGHIFLMLRKSTKYYLC